MDGNEPSSGSHGARRVHAPDMLTEAQRAGPAALAAGNIATTATTLLTGMATGIGA